MAASLTCKELSEPFRSASGRSLLGQTDAPQKSALDKATLEAYVRHLFVHGQADLDHASSDPKPSATCPGSWKSASMLRMGPQSQDFQFLVSKDGSKILQGNVYDVNEQPVQERPGQAQDGIRAEPRNAGAPVVLVEFSDFQCPYCKEEAKMLRQNLRQALSANRCGSTSRLSRWNAASVGQGRGHRQPLRLPAEPGAFWAFHDWVFEHQAEITPENLKDKMMEWAEGQKELDALQLGQCMDTKATEAEVDKVLAGRQGAERRSARRRCSSTAAACPQTIDWPNLQHHHRLRDRISEDGQECRRKLRLRHPLEAPGDAAGQDSPALPAIKK